MAKFIEKIGEMVYDNLIADPTVKIITESATILSGAGALKRGTVLGIGTDGKLGVLGNDGLTAHAILCDDVDASGADVVAEVYLTGKFNANALIVKDSYTMTAEDIANLRNGGIFLENAVK